MVWTGVCISFILKKYRSFKNWKLFFCVSLRYEMSGKLHLICMKPEGFHAKIRCNLNDISYLSETQKNNFQFL